MMRVGDVGGGCGWGMWVGDAGGGCGWGMRVGDEKLLFNSGLTIEMSEQGKS